MRKNSVSEFSQVAVQSEPVRFTANKNPALPFRVYDAHALPLEENQLDIPGHEPSRRGDVSGPEALRGDPVDLILSRILAFPGRILILETQSKSEFSARVALRRKQFGQEMPVSCQRLEDLEISSENFDLLLLQEAVRHIEPMILFSKASELLSCGGGILIADKSTLSRPGYKAAHKEKEPYSLTDLLTLAERAGFKLVEHIDISDRAAPNPNHEGHDGPVGYTLLQFRKKAMQKWRVGVCEEKHSPEMRELFEKIFGHSMTPEMWQWKYGRGKFRAVGVWRENRLIAHYGGMLREILLFGQQKTAVQIGDVMVDPVDRGVLTRKGPFFLMAATFQERYIGFGKIILTGYGFPSERHMRIAERSALYADIGSMVEVEWKPAGKMPRCLTRLKVLKNQSSIWETAALDELWNRMAASLRDAVVGMRDTAYLRHRYLDHPHHNYQLLLVITRFSKQIRGLIVLRHDASESEIMDLIAPLHELPLLVAHARRVAGINGKDKLLLRIPQHFSAYFTSTEGVVAVRDMCIRIPTPIWSHAPAPETMRDRWWLTGGDMDFR